MPNKHGAFESTTDCFHFLTPLLKSMVCGDCSVTLFVANVVFLPMTQCMVQMVRQQHEKQ